MKKMSFSRRWKNRMLAYSSLLFGAVWMTACNDSYNNSNPGDGNIYTISASLTGGQETPPNASTGTGTLTGTYDPATYKLTYKLSWKMISGAPTGMHFHGPGAAGVAAPVVVGITGFAADSAGTLSGSVVITAGQAGDLLSGNWYVNIHTVKYPNGEIRGQIVTSKMTTTVTPGY